MNSGLAAVGLGVNTGAAGVGLGVKTGAAEVGLGVNTGAAEVGLGVNTEVGFGVNTGADEVGAGVSSDSTHSLSVESPFSLLHLLVQHSLFFVQVSPISRQESLSVVVSSNPPTTFRYFW